jgi:hypothetical protein
MDMGMPYKDFRGFILPYCSGLVRFFGGLATTAATSAEVQNARQSASRVG